MASDKRFVYVLGNRSTPMRYYTGVTANVTARLADHNAGRCPHTADGRPWNIDLVVEFTDDVQQQVERPLSARHSFDNGVIGVHGRNGCIVEVSYWWLHSEVPGPIRSPIARRLTEASSQPSKPVRA